MSTRDDSFREGGEDKKGVIRKQEEKERPGGGGGGGGDAGMLGKCKNVPAVSEKAREKREGGQGGVTAASFSGQAAVSPTCPQGGGSSCRSEQTGGRVTCA
jgi:hypothetical protein